MSEMDGMLLRRLGETVDGMRDVDLTLVRLKRGGAIDVITKDMFDADQAKPEQKREFERLRDLPRRTPVEPLAAFSKLVFLDADDRPLGYVCPPGDALFWSDSSFEKFLYPYYEQVRIFPEDDLRALKRQLRDPRRRKFILAVRHDRPSSPVIIDTGSGPCDGRYGEGPRLLVTEEFANAAETARWLTPAEFNAGFERLFAKPEG